MHLIALVARWREFAEIRALACPAELGRDYRCKMPRGHDLPHRAPSRLRPAKIVLWTSAVSWLEDADGCSERPSTP